MSSSVHLKTTDGRILEATLEDVLDALSTWLVRRNGTDLSPGTSLATSRVVRASASPYPVTVTLEVHVASESEQLVPAAPSEPSSEGTTT